MIEFKFKIGDEVMCGDMRCTIHSRRYTDSLNHKPPVVNYEIHRKGQGRMWVFEYDLTPAPPPEPELPACPRCKKPATEWGADRSYRCGCCPCGVSGGGVFSAVVARRNWIAFVNALTIYPVSPSEWLDRCKEK